MISVLFSEIWMQIVYDSVGASTTNSNKTNEPPFTFHNNIFPKIICVGWSGGFNEAQLRLQE